MIGSSFAMMPDCVLNRVFDFLSYDEVSQIRVLTKRINHLCQSHLNRGFKGAERYHAECIKEVKSKLPRRESVRRNHPLIRHSDILTAVETRLSLLSMTFMKFVDADLCCFIPGKVVDEIFRVLRKIRHEKVLPRAFDVLQELRDISSMAMEHFEEKIVPTFNLSNISLLSPKSTSSFLYGLPVADTSTPIRPSSSSSSPSSSANPGRVSMIGNKILVTDNKFRSLTKSNKKFLSDTRRIVKEFKATIQEQNNKISNLENVLSAQEAVIANQSELLKKQSAKLLNLEKHMISNKGKPGQDVEHPVDTPRGVKRSLSEDDEDQGRPQSSPTSMSSSSGTQPEAKVLKLSE
eukprot:TCALIF_10263-PA protein Name:"Similar to FBXO28 F-box only protein 28 (Homo sapiens)" AED:0.08 eAED:0.08 QI:0/0/0/0.66/1/1/3/0/348